MNWKFLLVISIAVPILAAAETPVLNSLKESAATTAVGIETPNTPKITSGQAAKVVKPMRLPLKPTVTDGTPSADGGQLFTWEVSWGWTWDPWTTTYCNMNYGGQELCTNIGYSDIQADGECDIAANDAQQYALGACRQAGYTDCTSIDSQQHIGIEENLNGDYWSGCHADVTAKGTTKNLAVHPRLRTRIDNLRHEESND